MRILPPSPRSSSLLSSSVPRRCRRLVSLLVGVATAVGLADATNVEDVPHPFLGKVQPFGYQSVSSNGNDFAASVARSPSPRAEEQEQGYFLTGTTSGMLLRSDEASGENVFHAGMHCYVARALPFRDELVWIKKFGAFKRDTPVPTTCTSVEALPWIEGDDAVRLVVTGYTEGDVLFNPDDGDLDFSELVKEETEQNKINGFAMILSVPILSEEEARKNKRVDPSTITVVGGRMLHVERVTYPVGSTIVDDNDFVVASMVTDETGINLDAALKDANGEIGDFEPVFRYGQSYKVKTERLSFDSDEKLTRKLWSEIHAPDNGVDAKVTSVIFNELENAVTLAGSTHGNGEAFGHTSAGDNAGADLDGFLFTLDADTGKLNKVMTRRVETVPGKDDFISGMCKKTNGDALYVVGSTDALIDEDFVRPYDDDGKFNAFVRKINLNNMKPIWTRQIGPVNLRNDHFLDNHDVVGGGCAVDEADSIVYVSGTVAAGASVVEGEYPTGEQDVFVAAFQSTHGTPIKTFPTRQLGSVMDEYVAKDGGGLTTDRYGNAVLFGTTKGNFLREKPPRATQFQVPFADIYLMSFLVDDAEHVSTIEMSGPDGVVSPTTLKSSPSGKSQTPLETAAIALFGTFAVVVIFVMAYRTGSHQAATQIENQTDRDIARYLEEFEGGGIALGAGSGETDPGNSSSAATADGPGRVYDVSDYYGQNFAMGREGPSSSSDAASPVVGGGEDDDVPPIGSSRARRDDDVVGAASTSSNTYDELMESYKSIMSSTDTTTTTGRGGSSGKGKYDDDDDNDNDEHMIL